MEMMIGDENICLRQRSYKRKYIIVGVGALLVGFLVGILLGWFAIPRNSRVPEVSRYEGAKLTGNDDQSPVKIDIFPDISLKLRQRINADNIRKYLRNITSRPHFAGTQDSHNLAHQLIHFWESIGLDEVKLTPYDIMMSYANTTDPNRIEFIDGDGNIAFTSNIVEKTLTDKDDISDVVPPFSGFSPSADIEGDLIYVNYGRQEDFGVLTKFMSINVTGKIVIARYGKIFRGDIVEIAYKFGAKGVILYSDPADYTWGEKGRVYPEDWWLPGSAVQRGTISSWYGDALTPGYPAISSAYRLQENETDPPLPQIPCHPIGYNDAEFLLRQLDGYIVPEGWQGKLNFTYRVGGLKNSQAFVKMHVTTQNERTTVYNAIGIIRGSVEPDRYVIIGNHRDAWGHGAFDPSSGSAIVKEISRVMAELVMEGWRPRRSIIFCSWGAEEFGLIGSTEWVEQYSKVLGERAVAYFNIDTAIQGNYSLDGGASPLLYSTIYEAAKKIPNPDERDVAQGLNTVYDKWLKTFPWRTDNGTLDRPHLSNLGASSDYASFYQRLGIPSLDFHYVYDKTRISVAYHPLYHTAFDTFYAFESFVDNGFQYSKTMANIWAESIRYLADSVILPFNVNDYAAALSRFKDSLFAQNGRTMVLHGNISLDELEQATETFTEEAIEFHRRLETLDKENSMVVRMVNDQMMQLERAFTDPAGLPGRPLYKHVVFAPSAINSYAGTSFPGIVDALFGIEDDPDKDSRWEEVKHHYSVVVYTIHSAASTLRDVTSFMSDSFV